MKSEGAWEEYWRVGAITTFGDKPTYQGELRRFWLDFLDGCAPGDVLLDLGSGNGAIEEIIWRFCEEHDRPLTVHAVDSAKLSPRIKPGKDSPCTIIWHPETRNEDTGLSAASVNGVVGNFGFEYGDIPQTVREIARVILPGGRCRFLMHHAESVIMLDTRAEIAVLEQALAADGLFDLTREFLRAWGHIKKVVQWEKARRIEMMPALKALEIARQRTATLATSPNGQAAMEALSRTVLSFITPPALLRPRHELMDQLKIVRAQYRANLARLKDMENAAIDKDRLAGICAEFETAGMKPVATTYLVKGFNSPVGWQLDVRI